MSTRFVIAAVVAGFASVVIAAEPPKKAYVVTNEEVGVPVFPHDITDRPYGERGEKLGADAVIKAQYGDARVTMMSWGSSAATGIAIRFVDPAAAPAEPAATPPAR